MASRLNSCDPEQVEKSRRWIEFNDTEVRPVITSSLVCTLHFSLTFTPRRSLHSQPLAFLQSASED